MALEFGSAKAIVGWFPIANAAFISQKETTPPRQAGQWVIPMPAHVKFLARHALIGFSIGLLAAGAIVWLDLFNVGTLIRTSNQRWMAYGMLSFMFGLTFGSLQMGFAIMLLPYADE